MATEPTLVIPQHRLTRVRWGWGGGATLYAPRSDRFLCVPRNVSPHMVETRKKILGLSTKTAEHDSVEKRGKRVFSMHTSWYFPWRVPWCQPWTTPWNVPCCPWSNHGELWELPWRVCLSHVECVSLSSPWVSMAARGVAHGGTGHGETHREFVWPIK